MKMRMSNLGVNEARAAFVAVCAPFGSINRVAEVVFDLFHWGAQNKESAQSSIKSVLGSCMYDGGGEPAVVLDHDDDTLVITTPSSGSEIEIARGGENAWAITLDTGRGGATRRDIVIRATEDYPFLREWDVEWPDNIVTTTHPDGHHEASEEAPYSWY